MNLGIILIGWLVSGIVLVAFLLGSGIVSIDFDIDVSFDDPDDPKSDPEEPEKS